MTRKMITHFSEISNHFDKKYNGLLIKTAAYIQNNSHGLAFFC